MGGVTDYGDQIREATKGFMERLLKDYVYEGTKLRDVGYVVKSTVEEVILEHIMNNAFNELEGK